MAIDVVAYSEEWPAQFLQIASELGRALGEVPTVSIEHVGSTSVPGLAAKPVLDIDIVVRREHVAAAIASINRRMVADAPAML